MALINRKITGWAQPVSSLDDKPKLTAAALKAAFDSNSNELKPAVNGLIDDLTGTGGAGEIGVSPVEGVSGTTVQAMLAALKAMIDLCETQAGSAAALALKADKATVAKLVKTVAFNAQTGVFTITEQGGTVHTIDTVLEKVPMSCRLDGQDFVLMLEDGTEQRVSLAAFLTPQEFVNSDTVQFEVAGNTIRAKIKSGSIDADMLTGTILEELTAFRDAAAFSAAGAAASEQNAAAYETAAARSAQAADEKAAESGGQAVNARSWAAGGTGTRTGEDTDNAKYYRDQALLSATQAGGQAGAASASAARAEAAAADAEAIAGGDFIPTSRLGQANGAASLDGDGRLPAGQLPLLIDCGCWDDEENPDAAALALHCAGGNAHATMRVDGNASDIIDTSTTIEEHMATWTAHQNLIVDGNLTGDGKADKSLEEHILNPYAHQNITIDGN